MYVSLKRVDGWVNCDVRTSNNDKQHCLIRRLESPSLQMAINFKVDYEQVAMEESLT